MSRCSLRYLRLLFLFVTALPVTLHAATITVNSVADTVMADGQVTLREALISIEVGFDLFPEVAAVGPYGVNDTVRFAIAGSGVHTITIGSPYTVNKAAIIDGYTQPGSHPNTLPAFDDAVLQIEIRGNGSCFGGFFLGADGSVIRGLVINNMNGPGITVQSGNNRISGNFIGTDATGKVRVPNGIAFPDGSFTWQGGILLIKGQRPVTNNVIGGTIPADRNVLSGNFQQEILVEGFFGGVDTNTIEGNFIGAGADGVTYLGTGPTPIPNSVLSIPATTGVHIQEAPNTKIGGITGTTPSGPCTGSCNVIVAEGLGVLIEGAGSIGTTILGNFLGPDPSGNAQLALPPNAAIFIHFDVPGTVTIGGTTPAARNIITGYRDGVFIGTNPSSASPTVIQGNYFGLNSAGTATLGSEGPAEYAIECFADNVLIGGTAAGAGNVIDWIGFQNPIAGIFMVPFLNSSGGVTIQGNHIGLLADGISSVSLPGPGIKSERDGDIIGAAVPGGAGGNTIANNAQGGVILTGVRNSVFGNSMFGNGRQLIDLNGDGATPNDPCDADSGGNGLQNFPGIQSAIANGSSITISGSLNSAPSSTYTLEFFSDSAASGQARTPIGSAIVTTDAGCNAAYSVTLPFAFAPSMIVRATATDALRNTSEFSAAAAVVLAPPIVSKTFSPSRIRPGDSSLLTVTLTNSNSVPLTGVAFADSYPPNLVNAAAPAPTTTCAGTLSVATPGGLSLTGATIPANATCTVSVAVTSANAAVDTNTIPAGAVTSSNAIPNASPASATLTVAFPPSATKTFNPAVVRFGSPSTLTIQLTNSNPFPMTNVAFTDLYPSGLQTASPSNVFTTCGGAVAVASNSVGLSGGAIPANAACAVSVSVFSPNTGSYPNSLPPGAITAGNTVPSTSAATATLLVVQEVPMVSGLALFALVALLAIIGAFLSRY